MILDKHDRKLMAHDRKLMVPTPTLIGLAAWGPRATCQEGRPPVWQAGHWSEAHKHQPAAHLRRPYPFARAHIAPTHPACRA